MFKKIRIVLQLLETRHRMGFRSAGERIAFYFQLNPVTNAILSFWFSTIAKSDSWSAQTSRWLLQNGFGFGALRNISPESRSRFSELVLGSQMHKSPQYPELLKSLEEDGYCPLPGFIAKETVKAAHDYFGSRPHFKAQVFAQSNGIPIKKDWRDYGDDSSFRYVCFKQEDSLHFFEQELAAKISSLKAIADAYCGFETHLYGVNTFCTLPGATADYAMRLHRDYDDFNFLTMFIAWTETSAQNGATLFVPRSHRSSQVGTNTLALSAKPGDVFCADTFGLHAGNVLVKNSRLATWFRFGHKINLATIQDGA